ncbi:MAG: hypothetical protein QOE29_1383, partial [Gaiellaceae bacterium]|nr:hypothetical protein [Gaiellaceae bacterium]
YLVEHLVADPAWLGETLGIEDPEPVASHARAAKLLMLRRYAAKLDYELELHAAEPNLDAMPRRYSELLGSATRVQWPQASWLSDVDGGFYVACYLRAWALEMHWRDALRERFGERWYANAAAGDWLRGLWREGQRLSAEELLSETLDAELGFKRLTAELGSPTSAAFRPRPERTSDPCRAAPACAPCAARPCPGRPSASSPGWRSACRSR